MSPSPKLLCLVTDRRRLALLLGRPPSQARDALLQQIAGAVAGGVDLVQIREGDLDAGELASLVRAALAIAAGSPTRIVVNDRLDVAIATGAAGVHLRENSVSVEQAKMLGGVSLIGRSVHTAEAAARARSADYLIAGSVFPTVSKPESYTPLGLDGLASVVGAAGSTPVLAIGGVSGEHVEAVTRAGAAGVAAIGAFLPCRGSDDIMTCVQKKVTALRFAFDSASTVS